MEMTNAMTATFGVPASFDVRGTVAAGWHLGATRVRGYADAAHAAGANADVPTLPSTFQTIKSAKSAPPPRGALR
jgi:hypothetical protein